MCPIPRRAPPRFTSPRTQLDIWASLATCMISTLFENRFTNTTLCAECFSDINNPSQYRHITRHYIHVGNVPEYLECTECCVIFASDPSGPARPASKNLNFLHHVRDSGDNVPTTIPRILYSVLPNILTNLLTKTTLIVHSKWTR